MGLCASASLSAGLLTVEESVILLEVLLLFAKVYWQQRQGTLTAAGLIKGLKAFSLGSFLDKTSHNVCLVCGFFIVSIFQVGKAAFLLFPHVAPGLIQLSLSPITHRQPLDAVFMT